MDLEKLRKCKLERQRRKCFSCISHMCVMRKNHYKGNLYLKKKYYSAEDIIGDCKYGIEGTNGPDEYEMRHQLHDTKSPYSHSMHLYTESSSIGVDGDDVFIKNAMPRCEGFAYRFDITKKKAAYTQLALWNIQYALLCNKQQLENTINKVLNAGWSVMHKKDGKWQKMTFNDKVTITKRLRIKYSIYGYIDYIIEKIKANPTCTRPRNPAINMCWPFLNEELRAFYSKWIRIGDNKIMQEVADMLLTPYAPEYTQEYIRTNSHNGMMKIGNEWIKKPIIETRRRVRRSDILLNENDIDNMHNSAKLWHKFNHSELYEGENVCLICGIDITKRIDTLYKEIRELSDNEFCWITSKIPINKLCLEHLNELKIEYIELVRRGYYQPFDINYEYDFRKEEGNEKVNEFIDEKGNIQELHF